MPAMLDDPTAPRIYRVSGQEPYPTPGAPLMDGVTPHQVTLRDRVTTATIVPFASATDVPLSLMSYLCAQLNKLIEEGDSYPMVDPLSLESFGPYWFGNFACIMIVGDIEDDAQVRQMAENGADWTKLCLGTFYIKPNYPGRSSHVCNAGFITTDAARNRGVGRLMGEQYLKWAPKLGYTYSVFNLVYDTNVASCRIWDALGFKRIGRVKGCGNLKSYPDRLVDAIIYGRELGQDEETEGDATEERFDKIKYYLKHGTYPNGADRAEKSRLRSAAAHYKLVAAGEEGGGEEKLTLKGKEVVSDPKRQYEVARNIHRQQDSSSKGHAGINKTTSAIAERYHWERIKATVNAVIKDCEECKALNKPPSRPNEAQPGDKVRSKFYGEKQHPIPPDSIKSPQPTGYIMTDLEGADQLIDSDPLIQFLNELDQQTTPHESSNEIYSGSSMPSATGSIFHSNPMPWSIDGTNLEQAHIRDRSYVTLPSYNSSAVSEAEGTPVDPQIMEDIQNFTTFQDLDSTNTEYRPP